MNEQSKAPVPKIQAAGVSGAVAIVIVWILTMAGVDVPPTVASAFAIIIATAGGYLKSE